MDDDMAAAEQVTVGPLDLPARVDEALAVQALAFGLTAGEVAVRRHIVLRHMACPGARALGATTPRGGSPDSSTACPTTAPTGGRPSSSPTSSARATTPGWTTPSSSRNSTSTPTTRAGASAPAHHGPHRHGPRTPLDPLRHRHGEPGQAPLPDARLRRPGPPRPLPERDPALRGDGRGTPAAPPVRRDGAGAARKRRQLISASRRPRLTSCTSHFSPQESSPWPRSSACPG